MNQWCKGEKFSVSIGRPSYPWYWFSHLASFHLLPEWIGVSAMPHDCREPIQDVVHLFTFDVDLSAAYVEADNWLLLKFILNIVMDAIKYSDSKTQICIRSFKDDDRTIAIEVENLGWGISEEDLKPVEQSFYQAIPERSELGGIGLGLSLVARYELHGVSFSIHSQLGQGTTERVILSSMVVEGEMSESWNGD